MRQAAREPFYFDLLGGNEFRRDQGFAFRKPPGRRFCGEQATQDLLVFPAFRHRQLVTAVVVFVLRVAFDPMVAEGMSLGQLQQLFPEIGIERRLFVRLDPALCPPSLRPALLQSVNDILGVAPQVYGACR